MSVEEDQRRSLEHYQEICKLNRQVEKLALEWADKKEDASVAKKQYELP